jgi:hypothetical protein
MKLRKFAAVAGAMVLTLGLAGAVYADSGSPTSINAEADGMTVKVSGDWTWDQDSCGNNNDKIVGWAVDWGVPGYTDNPVPKSGGGNFYMGDSVQGNTVFTIGEKCGSFPGPWGPLSHTYAEPGEYDICVIIYDMRDGVTSGNHSNQAGGDDRNTDNSVEKNFQEGQSVCAGTSIVVETNPDIEIKKDAVPTTIKAGDDVTYNYLVTNTGDVDLINIEIVDDNGTPGDATDDFSSNDVDGIDCPFTSLAVGAHMTCTVIVSGTQVTTTNVAVVTGWTQKEDKVTDDDDATVTVGPAGSVGGETDTPTGPPTDTITSTTTDAGGALPLMLLVLGVIGLGAVVLTPRRAKR